MLTVILMYAHGFGTLNDFYLDILNFVIKIYAVNKTT